MSLLRAFKQALAVCGVTPEQIARAAQQARITDPLFWTRQDGLEALGAFARALAEVTGDARIGLRLALAMPRGATGALEYVLTSAPTLRAMHALYRRFGALAGESMHFEIEECDDHCHILVQGRADPPLTPVREDYRVARLLAIGRAALGRPRYTPMAVLFSYERPRSLEPYAHVFGERVKLEFGRAVAGLRLPSSLLDEPLVGAADPVLHSLLVHHAEALLDTTLPPTTMSARVRTAMLESLHAGRPTLASVSKRLGVSERTMRRRLDEEGSSFASLLDAARAGRLSELSKVKSPASKVLAGRLGFESTAALRRAKRRWASHDSERVDKRD